MLAAAPLLMGLFFGIEAATEAEPYKRVAQKALGADVTRRVHGETGLAKALQATDALFGGDLAGLSAPEIADVFGDVPSSEVGAEALAAEGKLIVDLLEESGVATSKGDARRSEVENSAHPAGRRPQEPRRLGLGRAQPSVAARARNPRLRRLSARRDRRLH